MIVVLRKGTQDIMDIAGTQVIDGVCLDCGGKECPSTSPVYIDHTPDCRGMQRHMRLSRALWERSTAKLSWLNRIKAAWECLT